MNEVSETALITLRSRIIESGKEDPVFRDPVGEKLYDELCELLPPELLKRLLERKFSPVLTSYLALRARKYDQLCLEFLSEFPEGLIVNLGCGFDTRYWRLGKEPVKYMELDLPGVIRLKKEALGDMITYPVLEGSVLDKDWINSVREIQGSGVLFLAEGLFMYFPEEDSTGVLKRIGDGFSRSRLVMEVVSAKYTSGIRKKMVERKMRRRSGSAAGDYYQYGIRNSSEIESYHPRFRITGEWSCFEDPDVKPSILRMLRHFRSFSRTQYTVVADIV